MLIVKLEVEKFIDPNFKKCLKWLLAAPLQASVLLINVCLKYSLVPR